jgi:hypothetical protein
MRLQKSLHRGKILSLAFISKKVSEGGINHEKRLEVLNEELVVVYGGWCYLWPEVDMYPNYSCFNRMFWKG